MGPAVSRDEQRNLIKKLNVILKFVLTVILVTPLESFRKDLSESGHVLQNGENFRILSIFRSPALTDREQAVEERSNFKALTGCTGLRARVRERLGGTVS
ncbi:hypothetical protein KCU99_g386, partial [Aureobasidium melanogenum]